MIVHSLTISHSCRMECCSRVHSSIESVLWRSLFHHKECNFNFYIIFAMLNIYIVCHPVCLIVTVDDYYARARQTDSSIVSFRVEKHSKFNLHCVQFASAYIARLLKFESGAEICKSTWHDERRRHFVFDVAKDCWNYACDTFSLLQIYFLPFFQESRNISSIPKVEVAQKFVCMSHAHGK